jgi:hypothetical protein
VPAGRKAVDDDQSAEAAADDDILGKDGNGQGFQHQIAPNAASKQMLGPIVAGVGQNCEVTKTEAHKAIFYDLLNPLV